MSENPNEGKPNEPGGGVANAQPSATEAQPLQGDLAQLVKGMQKKLDEQDAVIRALQSGKDKRLNEVEAVLPDIRKFAEYLGADEKQAQKAVREYALDRLIAKELGTSSPAAPSPAQVAPQAVRVEAGQYVTEYGLDPNDPQVASLLASASWQSPEQAELAVARLAMKAKSKPAPTPAQAAPPTTGGAPKQDVSELTKNYIRDMSATLGKPAEARAVRAKYKAMGVPVETVSFT